MLRRPLENRMQPKNRDEQGDAIGFVLGTSDNISFRETPATHRITVPAAVLLLLISIGIGQRATAQAVTPSSPTKTAGPQRITQIVMPVSLTTSLDSRKRKTGDEVVVKVGGAVTLKDGTVIPRGAKINGHVTEAKARSGGDAESSLAIVFDKIDLPDGKTLAIKGTMQAVAPNPNQDDSSGGVDYGSSMNRTIEHAQTTTSVSSPVPILTEQSVGVYGIKNLQLSPEGVLKSDEKSVKLANRSQIVLRAQLTAAN
jgi:hypothetical protein